MRESVARSIPFISPDALYHFMRGERFYQERSHEAAKREFHKVVKRNPSHFMANVYLGRINLKEEDFSQASRYYSRAQEIDPARYTKMKLIAEHVEALKLGAKKGVLKEALDNMERCANLLDNITRRIQEVAERQQRALERRQKYVDMIVKACEKFGKKETDANEEDRIDQEGEIIPEEGYGDFASLEEYQKFLSMPPISERELIDIDWDRFLKDLN